MGKYFACVRTAVAALAFGSSLSAATLLGLVGTESGVPILGQEDIVVYNFTGPSQGCSTVGGTPICTSVTFKNVVLSITAGSTFTVNLGDIAPGMTESYAFPNGVFADGSITDLGLTATLSDTALTDDLGNVINVAASISLTHLPVDGSFAEIDATLVNPNAAPEPANLGLAGLAITAGWLFASKQRRQRRTAAQ
jgi:hypothetical protein